MSLGWIIAGIGAAAMLVVDFFWPWDVLGNRRKKGNKDGPES